MVENDNIHTLNFDERNNLVENQKMEKQQWDHNEERKNKWIKKNMYGFKTENDSFYKECNKVFSIV